MFFGLEWGIICRRGGGGSQVLGVVLSLIMMG